VESLITFNPIMKSGRIEKLKNILEVRLVKSIPLSHPILIYWSKFIKII